MGGSCIAAVILHLHEATQQSDAGGSRYLDWLRGKKMRFVSDAYFFWLLNLLLFFLLV